MKTTLRHSTLVSSVRHHQLAEHNTARREIWMRNYITHGLRNTSIAEFQRIVHKHTDWRQYDCCQSAGPPRTIVRKIAHT